MKQKHNEKPWPLGVVQKVVHHDTKDEFHFGTKSLLIFRCKTCQSILPSHLANITLVLLPVTNNHLHLWPRFLIIFARILSFFYLAIYDFLLVTSNLLFSSQITNIQFTRFKIPMKKILWNNEVFSVYIMYAELLRLQ